MRIAQSFRVVPAVPVSRNGIVAVLAAALAFAVLPTGSAQATAEPCAPGPPGGTGTTPSIPIAFDLDAATPAHDGSYADGFALLPRGFARPGDPLGVFAGGRPLPAAVDLAGGHVDGSARVARLRVHLPRRRVETLALAPIAAGRAPPGVPGMRLVVTPRDDGGLAVATRGVDLDLPREDASLFAGLAALDPARPVRLTARVAGVAAESVPPFAPRDVGRSALDVALATAGFLVADDEPPLAFRLELEVAAGRPSIDAVLEVEATAPALVEDLALELPLRVAANGRGLFLGAAGAGGEGFALARGEGLEVVAGDGRSLVGIAAGGQIALDPAARVGLGYRTGGGVFALAVSRLRPHAPRAIELRADGRLRLVLLDGAATLETGEKLRVEFVIGVFSRGAARLGLAALAREPRPALRGGDAADLGFGAPLGVDTASPFDPAGRLLAIVDAATARVTGRRDYGDYRLGRGFANLEYDPAAAFLLRFHALGDARHLEIARDQARHLVLHDLSRGENGVPRGVPWMHGDDHRSLEYEAGHVFAGGLAHLALIERDRSFADAAHAMDEGLRELLRQRTGFDHERCYGWMLMALSDLARVARDRCALDGDRGKLIDRLLATQAPRGFFAIDRPGGDRVPPELAGCAYAPAPWVTAGITLEALFRVHRDAVAVDPSRTAAIESAVAALVPFLTVDARHENGEIAGKVGYDGSREVMVARAGVADPIDRLLYAAGLGRAGLLLGDAALLDAFDRERAAAIAALGRHRPSANDACRGLVAWRSIHDTAARR
jgi:hypothetical protein